jgi:hypothetical protein
MDYFTKWLEVYAICNQEASTAADTLVTSFVYHFWILRKLHRKQGQNFET